MLDTSESSRRRKKDPEGERRRPKSKDRDRDRDKDKDRERHRSSKSSRASGSSRKPRSNASREDVSELADRPAKERTRTRTSSTSAPNPLVMGLVPEMDRRSSMGMSSLNGSHTSLGYPTLSKTHAKENIYKREEPPADGGDEQREIKSPPPPTRAPPSPPLTATNDADLRKTASRNSMRRNVDELHKDMASGRQSVDSGTRLTPDPRAGAASRSSIRDADIDSTEFTSTTSSHPSTVRAKSPRAPPTRAPPPPPKAPPPRRSKTASPSNERPPGRAPSTTVRAHSRQSSEVTQSTGSDFTSIPPERQLTRRVDHSPTNSEVSPDSVVDSSPRTPTQHSVLPTVLPTKQGPVRPTVEIITDPLSRAQSADSYNESPLTPPPPPPLPALMDPPRVDYLLQNGGLKQPVPRTLLAAMDGTPVPAYSQYMSPRLPGPQTHDAHTFFNPLKKLLNDYNAVMDTSGSLAVATGYRSVARRLLDRLEAVFARNISSEQCPCIMCLDVPIHEDQAGVNWGEILELVSGRCDLPSWPPVDTAQPSGLGIADLEPPCQRIDVDVPEQYKEHYQQQARKTKVSVQSWLSNQQEAIPEDADDETLTFAMLTRLEQPQRPLFYAVLWGMDTMPHPRSAKDARPTPPYITKAAIALQRLYRLYAPPRDQLVVMYMIRNPNMHNTLATLAAVTKHEWEILVSGRFDGFLWSGAEPSPGSSRPSSGEVPTLGGPQRFASPFGAPVMSPRPGSARPAGPAPVQVDEETEIAVLAEVEREIYLGMEAMEDAFEALHIAAENVRRRLRERGAALSMVAQARRPADIEVRMGTPASVVGEESWGAGDGDRSEIGPDDSASNVSHNRRRRGHRERMRVRTPAVVEEDEGSSIAERVRRKY